MSSPLRTIIERLLDRANPTFVLTVLMRRSRRVFGVTVLMYAAMVTMVFLCSGMLPRVGPFSPAEFFEIGLLLAAGFSLVFLGSDYGAVFIEASFQDEQFRLTPVSPLQIVHGGMQAALFFSVLLFALTLPTYPVALLLGMPVLRIFFGTMSLFLIGQMFSMILIVSYIAARTWRQIAFGTAVVLLAFFLIVGFFFTPLGRLLYEGNRWPVPMSFLAGVFAAIYITAYFLARSHALSPRRSFRTTSLINACVFVPILIAAVAAALVLSRFV